MLKSFFRNWITLQFPFCCAVLENDCKCQNCVTWYFKGSKLLQSTPPLLCLPVTQVTWSKNFFWYVESIESISLGNYLSPYVPLFKSSGFKKWLTIYRSSEGYEMPRLLHRWHLILECFPHHHLPWPVPTLTLHNEAQNQFHLLDT